MCVDSIWGPYLAVLRSVLTVTGEVSFGLEYYQNDRIEMLE